MRRKQRWRQDSAPCRRASQSSRKRLMAQTSARAAAFSSCPTSMLLIKLMVSGAYMYVSSSRTASGSVPSMHSSSFITFSCKHEANRDVLVCSLLHKPALNRGVGAKLLMRRAELDQHGLSTGSKGFRHGTLDRLQILSRRCRSSEGAPCRQRNSWKAPGSACPGSAAQCSQCLVAGKTFPV